MPNGPADTPSRLGAGQKSPASAGKCVKPMPSDLNMFETDRRGSRARPAGPVGFWSLGPSENAAAGSSKVGFVLDQRPPGSSVPGAGRPGDARRRGAVRVVRSVREWVRSTAGWVRVGPAPVGFEFSVVPAPVGFGFHGGGTRSVGFAFSSGGREAPRLGSSGKRRGAGHRVRFDSRAAGREVCRDRPPSRESRRPNAGDGPPRGGFRRPGRPGNSP